MTPRITLPTIFPWKKGKARNKPLTNSGSYDTMLEKAGDP
jgi:hypothetical protein